MVSWPVTYRTVAEGRVSCLKYIFDQIYFFFILGIMAYIQSTCEDLALALFHPLTTFPFGCFSLPRVPLFQEPMFM